MDKKLHIVAGCSNGVSKIFFGLSVSLEQLGEFDWGNIVDLHEVGTNTDTRVNRNNGLFSGIVPERPSMKGIHTEH